LLEHTLKEVDVFLTVTINNLLTDIAFFS